MRGLECGGRPHTALRRVIIVGAVVVVTPVGWAYREFPGHPELTSYALPKSGTFLFGSGTLTTPNPTSKAITYDSDLAPIGAAMTATMMPSSEASTTAQLTVFGLLPNRGYAVQAHTKACGVSPDAAGPAFQNRIDPAATPQAPSSDPEFANPDNEIWLDVRTDVAGAGTSRTTVPFTLTDRVPGSIVVYEAMHTATDPDDDSKTGTRISCLTLVQK